MGTDDEFLMHYTFRCQNFRQCIRIAQYGLFFLIVNVNPKDDQTIITSWVQCVGRGNECKLFTFNLQMRIGNAIAHFTDYVSGLRTFWGISIFFYTSNFRWWWQVKSGTILFQFQDIDLMNLCSEYSKSWKVDNYNNNNNLLPVDFLRFRGLRTEIHQIVVLDLKYYWNRIAPNVAMYV